MAEEKAAPPLRRALFIRINIFQLGDVDTVSCTFSCTFFLTATWLEPTLDFAMLEALDPEARAQAIRAAFDPSLEFMNAVGMLEFEQGPDFQLVDWRRGHDGSPAVCVRMRVSGSFREQFELAWFPFDAQPLNLVCTSKHRTSALSLHGEAENSRVRTEFMVLPEFRMSTVQFCEASTANLKTATTGTGSGTGSGSGTGGAGAGAGKDGYALLYMGVIATRFHGYYTWNVFLPTFLLTLMSVTTFAVPVGDVADRLSVILTLVLTSVAFKFVVAQGLPKISYNTCLDYYVLVSFLLLAATVVECAVVGFLEPHDARVAADIDRVVLWVLVGSFGLWHAITLYAVSQARRKTRRRAIGPSDEAVRSGRVVVT